MAAELRSLHLSLSLVVKFLYPKPDAMVHSSYSQPSTVVGSNCPQPNAMADFFYPRSIAMVDSLYSKIHFKTKELFFWKRVSCWMGEDI